MGAVNWALIGFWGCGLALLLSGFLTFISFEVDAVFVSGLTATILSFIGLCLFGMFLWN